MLARSVATVKVRAGVHCGGLGGGADGGLRRHLMPQARPGALTPEEVERAESPRLKYLSDEWNFMR